MTNCICARVRVNDPPSARLRVSGPGDVRLGIDQHVPVRPVIDEYEGPYEVTPDGTEQVLVTDGLAMAADVTVHAAPLETVARTVSASGTSAITPDPGYYGIGEVDLTVPEGKVIMRRPTLDEAAGEVRSRADVTAGYVAPGGTYSGSALLLDKQAATTVTPTESAQVAVAQYRWTTGEVDVAAIPSDYVGSAVERRDSSDLAASGPTVTVPAGYYDEAASKTVASGSATTPATTITADPSITVGSDGLVTATASATQSVTPIVSVGYVTSGTAGTVTVGGTGTLQLTVGDGLGYGISTQPLVGTARVGATEI